MLARLLNLGGKADAGSTALARFLLESEVNRRALFELIVDATQAGERTRHLLDIARDLWPELSAD